MNKSMTAALVIIGAMSLTACTASQQTMTGAAIGSATGAVVGASVAGTPGAILGAAGGAAAGVAVSDTLR